MTKECELCGRAFEPNAGSQKYCSAECRKIADAPKHRERCRKSYHRHRKEKLEKAKAYYHANKDKIMQRRKIKKDNREQNFFKRMDNCCLKHGGIDNCPFEDCICE